MKFFLTLILLFCFQARANLLNVRWTLADQKKSDWSSIVTEVSKQLQIPLTPADFKLIEQKKLNGMNYTSYQQIIAGQPVKEAGVRLWQNPEDGKLLQMIAWIQNPQSPALRLALQNWAAREIKSDFSYSDAAKLAKTDLKKIMNFTSKIEWVNEKLILIVRVFGRDRSVEYHLDPLTRAVLFKKMRLFPREDGPSRKNQDDEYSVQGKVFKVNEEYEMAYGRKVSEARPENVELKYLKKQFKGSEKNWIDQLEQKHFEYKMMDPVKAATPEGLAAGYWSRETVAAMIDRATQLLPWHANQLETGARFFGRYAQVAIHADAFKQFKVTAFSPFYSDFVSQSFGPSALGGWAIDLDVASLGKPFYAEADLLNRRAPYEIIHDTNAMINEGFDEMQVYWSVTSWFELMHEAGFTDQELSTRPIRAFLFDPNIESQDNAYYNDDTINFATYTERNANEARNLITVWHELGHGLMDRLQGSSGFDNGGLSEGIADFASEMVLRGFYRLNVPNAIAGRRINNQIGFQLTNEDHDGGEAYGGSLKDLLDRKIQAEGFSSYAKTCDLVLDAMRLTRGSPNLSLNEWYEALNLADQIGKPGLRSAGEYAPLLAEVFENRNYFYQSPKGAGFHLFYQDKEVSDVGEGSRNSPLPVSLADGKDQDFLLKVKVTIDDNPHYSYPLKVVVAFKETNALQGALKFKNEDDQTFTIKSAGETLEIPVGVLGGCEFINTSEGFCKDFVNVQIFSKDQSDPFAKKRFYFENKF